MTRDVGKVLGRCLERTSIDFDQKSKIIKNRKSSKISENHQKSSKHHKKTRRLTNSTLADIFRTTLALVVDFPMAKLKIYTILALFCTLIVICVFVYGGPFLFWGGRGGVSSPRGAKSRKSRLARVTRVPVCLGCCQARFQLSNAHRIASRLARTAILWRGARFFIKI